ncbi:MAG: hypothetical protein HUU20_03235 [Pirellulales bacterium]|nr:hypothetical protein [Pirellulales bacterium]
MISRTVCPPLVRGLLATCLLYACGSRPVGAADGGAAQAVRLVNHRLELWLAPTDGRVEQIRDLNTGHDHLAAAARRSPLWSFQATADGKERLFTPADAKSFRWQLLGTQTPALRLTWTGFDLAAAPGLTVEVKVQLDEREPTSVWEISLRSPGRLSVEEIHFPVVSGVAFQEHEVLAVPHWMGEKAAEPRKLLGGRDGRGRRLEWPYPGHLSLQCLAWYRENGPGLYAASHDATAQRKGFAVWGDTQSQVHIETVHYPAPRSRAEDAISPGYPVHLGTFCGDWLTAAERYRTWGAEQAWARESRLKKAEVPDWVLQTGLWVWNRGRSPGVLPPAAAMKRELGLPVSVFWHWWHGCPYDTGFPEYLPPREGAKEFRAALAEAHREDVRALVYMNQRLWGMTTKSWTGENAAAFAVKGPGGAIRPEVYNTFTRQPCASMCMGTSFWRNKYAGLAEEAVADLGVDGIYMDQACSSLPCYDASHGHPLGAGSFWTEGFQKLAADIRRRSQGRPVALAGEGCGEAWLPHLDLMLTLQVSRERYAAIQDGWEVIPFFHAVYHPFGILYGNYSSLTVPPYDDLWPAEHAPPRPLELLDRKFSGQFCLEQARAFVWGQQPTIANFLPSQSAERRREIDYMVRLAKVRQRAQKYLVHGTFLRPPAIDAPAVMLDFSRLSIYAGQKDRVQSFEKTCPAALAAAWQAPDGNVGIALASIVDRPMTLTLRPSRELDSLPRGATVVRIDEDGPAEAGRIEKGSAIVELDPLDACLLEITALPCRSAR